MLKFRLLFLALLLVAGGCQLHEDATDKNDGKNAEMNGQQFRNNTNGNINSKENEEISVRLEKAALEVPHVKAADAVVLGDYVFVAVDVDKNIDRSQVGSIKYSVTERLQNDPYGKRAIVVADPDIIARLKEVGQDIAAGKPIQGILNELSDIAGRIMPEIHENTNNTDTNQQQQMPSNDQKQLNKEKQEQSNNHMK